MFGRVIDLAGHEPLFRGNMRNVYALPSRPRLLLKTIRPERVDARGFFAGYGRVKNLRPWGCYHVFQRELAEFVIQARRHRAEPSFLLPIAHPAGLVRTTEGLGMLVENVVGADGRPAPTYAQLAATGSLEERHYLALREFAERCADLHVVLGDFNEINVVYTEARRGGPECVCVDGFGERTVVPVRRWSRLVNARRLRRAVRLVEDRLRAWPR